MSDSEQGYQESSHAEQRKNEGRPVSSAFADAQRAQQGDIFVQLDGRLIVRGPRGREHIFEPTGELVTSLSQSRRVHLAKTRRRERQPVTDEQFEAFREIFE